MRNVEFEIHGYISVTTAKTNAEIISDITAMIDRQEYSGNVQVLAITPDIPVTDGRPQVEQLDG